MPRPALLVALALSTGVGLACALQPADAGGKGGRQFALLVACGDYDINELKKLPFAASEMAEFRKVLINSGFADGDVRFLRDAAPQFRYTPTRANIEKELDIFLNRVEKGDTLLVALNGHGLQFKGDKTGYFCPIDTQVLKKETLLAMDELFASC